RARAGPACRAGRAPAGLPRPAPGARTAGRYVQARTVTAVAPGTMPRSAGAPPSWTPGAGAWHNAASTERPMSKSQDTALRLMIVDDSPEAAEAIVSTLRNAGIAVRPLRPASADELAGMLAAQPV